MGYAGALACVLRSLRMNAGTGDSNRSFALEHDGERLLLDVALLGENVSLKPGSLYMVIGEIEMLPAGPCLQARVARNCDGMDVELFAAALKLHRRFEQQQAA